jgi:phosphate butyryltransferase
MSDAAPFSFAAIDGSSGIDETRAGAPTAMAPVALAVAAAEEADVLRAVAAATARGIVTPTLFGNRTAIERVAETVGFDLQGISVEDIDSPAQAAQAAVASVARGEHAILMKGLVDTADLLRAVLDRETGLRGDGLLSHVALFEVAGFPRPLTITDAAMNIAPDRDAKRQILRNAVSFLHAIGYTEPRVAVIAAKEKVNEQMVATVDAAALAAEQRDGTITGCIVDGPFALDNAVSLEAAQTKGITSPVAGAADVLLMPQIEAGNVLYKALAFLVPSRHAGIIVGARAPIVLTSRADSDAAKLDSIALAAYAAAPR